MVVWAHLGALWPTLHGETSFLNETITKLVVNPFRIFQDGGLLGVVLFFLISGYIITYTAEREDRTSFAVKRILRLGPPLVAALAAAWAYIHIAGWLSVKPIAVQGGDWVHWVSALFLMDGWIGPHALDVTWTLVVELIFYTLTFALLGLSRRRPEAATWAMTGLWAALCMAVSVTPALSASANFTVPRYAGFLLVGRAIYLWQARRIRPITAALTAALALLLHVAFTENVMPGFLAGSTDPTKAPFYSYAYALVIFLALMAAAPKRTVQPFTLLGDISYSLYLLHVPVGFLTLEVTRRWGFPPDLMILSAIATSIAAAWASYLLVERPSQRLARTLLRRRAERRAA
jgi:peptidoglycan/LPS O-acetylase OafA/YrhL